MLSCLSLKAWMSHSIHTAGGATVFQQQLVVFKPYSTVDEDITILQHGEQSHSSGRAESSYSNNTKDVGIQVFKSYSRWSYSTLIIRQMRLAIPIAGRCIPFIQQVELPKSYSRWSYPNHTAGGAIPIIQQVELQYFNHTACKAIQIMQRRKINQ